MALLFNSLNQYSSHLYEVARNLLGSRNRQAARGDAPHPPRRLGGNCTVWFVRTIPNPTRKRGTSCTSLTRRVVLTSMNLRNSPSGGTLAKSMQFPVGLRPSQWEDDVHCANCFTATNSYSTEISGSSRRVQ
jgi:hypothetical protein